MFTHLSEFIGYDEMPPSRGGPSATSRRPHAPGAAAAWCAVGGGGGSGRQGRGPCAARRTGALQHLVLRRVAKCVVQVVLLCIKD